MMHTHQARNVRRRHGSDGPTEKMREYLEVIYCLSRRGEPVISARLADWMHVTPPTVTNIVKRMEDSKYITRDLRGEIRLTAEGFGLAEAVVRRHRILECFLVQVLGVPWHQVHEEAVRLEHALSPIMEARIEALVGASPVCPHGNAIPGNASGAAEGTRLDQIGASQRFTVRRIGEEAEEDSDLLRYFEANGIVPGATFGVSNVSPLYGVTLHSEGQSITLTPQIAAQLWGETA